ncbi:MAG: polyphosphate kinase 1 [Candidatus Omnitrophica bacterium]|nr:polyphosphate kinase 1 [Candidatus Omnitrophota bacterium]
MAKNDPKDIYIHRDISWLDFNERVLEEAEDPANPILERLRFMAIFANNLDEFFMVRVSGVKRLIDAGYNSKDKFGWYPYDLYKVITERTDALSKRLYDLRDRKIMKDLAKNLIFVKRYEELDPEQLKYAKKYFNDTLYPIITPIAVDQGHPFPIILSKSLSFAVELAIYKKKCFAVIIVPQNVPRLIKLPSERDELNYILMEEVMKNNIERFFRGHKLVNKFLFRVIRDSELSVDEEYEEDLLSAIDAEIKKRPRAKVIALEVEKDSSPELLANICESIVFPFEEVTRINNDLDLTYFFEMASLVPMTNLCYKSFVPASIQYGNIFDKMKEGDFIIHLPFQSFKPTVDLVKSASVDPGVLAIKMTLYRTNRDSDIVKALKEAAKNKKQVTVLVEIKARFDEEANIRWARELEESGCHVMYGIPGMKIHSKITLVIRREEDRIRRYVHLSTGNYNEKTASLYTDCGYFTANDDFARDISDVFNVITGYSLPSRWKRIVASPYDLRQYYIELIDKEIESQKSHGNGGIFAKLNSLEDVFIIDKLYEASKAGVKINLLVRGICALVPGVKGLSENISVRSIVGRFLEHSRVFITNNNNDKRIFLSSADWMRRNFDRRIELLFEIYDEKIKDHLKMVMELYWKDDVKARILTAQGKYERAVRGSEPVNAQENLIGLYS